MCLERTGPGPGRIAAGKHFRVRLGAFLVAARFARGRRGRLREHDQTAAGSDMDTMPLHHTHADIIKRLKRAEGHLKSVVEMIENGRSCVDVAQQLHAIEKAITHAKRAFIHDHLDDCLEVAVGPLTGRKRRTIDEFKEITKYL